MYSQSKCLQDKVLALELPFNLTIGVPATKGFEDLCFGVLRFRFTL